MTRKYNALLAACPVCSKDMDFGEQLRQLHNYEIGDHLDFFAVYDALFTAKKDQLTRLMQKEIPAAAEERPHRFALSRTKRTTGILLPPGTRLRGWIGIIFSSKSCQRVFDPIIADMQLEWLEAHKSGKTIRARWVQLCCSFFLIKAIIVSLPFSVVRWIWDAWKTLG